MDSSDPFAQIASAQEPSLTLKQPPKWLKRPVGVSFGFGGKLVAFNNKSQIKHVVTVSTVITEPEIIQRSIELLQNTAQNKDKLIKPMKRFIIESEDEIHNECNECHMKLYDVKYVLYVCT